MSFNGNLSPSSRASSGRARGESRGRRRQFYESSGSSTASEESLIFPMDRERPLPHNSPAASLHSRSRSPSVEGFSACVLYHGALSARQVQQRERACQTCRSHYPSSNSNTDRDHRTNDAGDGGLAREPSDAFGEGEEEGYISASAGATTALGSSMGRLFPRAREDDLPAGLVESTLPDPHFYVGSPPRPRTPWVYLSNSGWESPETHEESTAAYQRPDESHDASSRSSSAHQRYSPRGM
ncbi:hypothetical protein SCP_0405160 [Sparassis crispa]|uniref:Uncharacterized protein n=1 Tax=Sparassis crispa TaxID=139825 RepID=A0A401GIY0_9APHY|nr:hypothetical protein SCP_0405160 [Sparassis crispa]GBE82136.1 hypothetical protein SCP_0405160 [Sparassis crispa]